ncbi:MAG: hypothetical protein PHE24_06970 [Patescibacteria group bacterium]|nr:hypothetical protein [Patescibacteria group bacterium]
MLNQYLQARFIAFGEAYTPVPQWKIIAMIKALEPPTVYFDVLGRKIFFNPAPGRFRVCRQAGLRAIVIH